MVVGLLRDAPASAPYAQRRIVLVKDASCTWTFDLRDEAGAPPAITVLTGAVARFWLKRLPSDATNLLEFTTETSTHLELSAAAATLVLSLAPADTAPLPVGGYLYQVNLKLADGAQYHAVDWSPLEVRLGGAADPAPVAFENTVVVNHDHDLPDSLRYLTPGGTPIKDAQIRVYLKADYDAVRLTAPEGVTMTDANGRWRHAVLVRPGFSYVIQFLKPNEFGPDTATIVV